MSKKVAAMTNKMETIKNKVQFGLSMQLYTFSEDFIQSIAKSYSFKEYYNLTEVLNRTAMIVTSSILLKSKKITDSNLKSTLTTIKTKSSKARRKIQSFIDNENKLTSNFYVLRDCILGYSPMLELISNVVFLALRRAEDTFEANEKIVVGEWFSRLESFKKNIKELTTVINLAYASTLSPHIIETCFNLIKKILLVLNEMEIRASIALDSTLSPQKNQLLISSIKENSHLKKQRGNSLVKRLAQIYEEGTKKRATVIFDNYNDKGYHGPFLSFVTDIAGKMELDGPWENIVRNTLYLKSSS